MKNRLALRTALLLLPLLLLIRVEAEASCQKYWLYYNLYLDANNHANAYIHEGSSGMVEAADSVAQHWRDMANGELDDCDDRSAHARYWAEHALETFNRSDALSMLLDVGRAHEYGLAVSEPDTWRDLRTRLKSTFAAYGLQFIAPETYGSIAFHNAVNCARSIIAARARAATARRRVSVGGARLGKNNCKTPNADAQAIDMAEPSYPDIAQQQGATGKTEIKVSIDNRGIVQAADIYQSSGNEALDNSALEAAQHSKYRPSYVNCKPVSGSYLFFIDW